MLTCASWVKRGVAKEIPDRVELSKDEIDKLFQETSERVKEDKAKIDDTERQEGMGGSTLKGGDNDVQNKDEDDELDEYEFENYDEEDEGEFMTGAGMAGLTYFTSNNDDPYITMKNIDDEERDDFVIKQNDNLIVIGKMEEEYCNLEVYVYNEDEGSLYVHHDIMLESVPLVIEWLNYDVAAENQLGNFVAVGTMDPHIEIWDLDVVDTLESVVTLGKKPRKKKKKKKPVAATPNDGHTDAVLGLSWNSNARNVLASGSADKTVMLWDMQQCRCVHTLRHHNDKVQTLQWHPYESQSLLTGSYDRSTYVLDCRDPESGKKCWNLDGEVERVLWDHLSPYNFLASTDQGTVYYHDVRSSSSVFQISAHNKAVTGLSLSSDVQGCLVTASSDKTVKVWDFNSGKPAFVMSKDMKMGCLNFTCSCPDSSLTFVFGGEKDGLRLLNLLDTAAGKEHFGKKNIGKVKAATVHCDDSTMDTESAENAFASLSLQSRTDSKPKDIVKRKKKKTKK